MCQKCVQRTLEVEYNYILPLLTRGFLAGGPGLEPGTS